MNFLIDFDNLPKRTQRKTLRQIIEILLDKIDFQSADSIVRVSCRLYGGWLKGKTLSHKAEKLSKQISQDFPTAILLSGKPKILVNAELATSLVCDIQNDFTHTFRMQSPPSFSVRRFPLQGCSEPSNCPILATNHFVFHGVCTHSDCNISPQEAFYRAEQKLVDTMIVVDLVHFSIHQKECLVVVSGDHDMWPGIRYALLQNASIIHIVPGVSNKRKNAYNQLITERYTRVLL